MNNTHPSNLKVRRLTELPQIPQEEIGESVLYATANNKDYKVGTTTYVDAVVEHLGDELAGIGEVRDEAVEARNEAVGAASLSADSASEAAASAVSAEQHAADSGGYASAAEESALLAEQARLSGPPTGYATRAEMEGNTSEDEGALALVTNDPIPDNNGTWRWNGSAWVQSEDRVSQIEPRVLGVERDLLSTEITVDALVDQSLEPLSDGLSRPGVVFGIVDQEDRLGFGLTAHGDVLTAAGEDGPLGQNNLDLVYAITDQAGSVAFGVRSDGTLVGVADPYSGPGLVGTPYVDGGDVYLVQGAEVTQVTGTGDNSAPHILGGRLRFLSTRRGELAEYAYDGEFVGRAYADAGRYEQVIITGQSLAQGGANPALTTTPPYPENAFKFTNGPVGNGAEVIVPTIAPLAEAVNETISTGFAKKLLSYALDRTMLVCGQAQGGQRYSAIKKGGTTNIFSDCIKQVGFGNDLLGGSAVRAVFLIHGEADGNAGNTDYANNLVELLNDYTADVKAENGQHEPPVMLLCQTSSASGYRDLAERDVFATPFLQLQAASTHPRIFMVGPKYHLTYKDYAHIDAESTRLWGEYYAKVYRRVVIEGEDWKPVSPSEVNVSGSDVVIDFHVPVGPLVLDTVAVVDPGNYGFNLLNAGAASITDVTLTGASQVTISLSAPPPSGAVLSYAFHNGIYTKSGWAEGARGCLRDSDTEPSEYTGQPMHNWCAAFNHTF